MLNAQLFSPPKAFQIDVARRQDMVPKQVFQTHAVAGLHGLDHSPVFVAGAAQIDRIDGCQRTGPVDLLGRLADKIDQV